MRYGARAGIVCGTSVLVLTLCILTTGCNEKPASTGEKGPKAASNYKTGLPPKEVRAVPMPGETKRIIMLINGSDPYWDAMKAGMDDAERDFKLRDAGFKVE